MATDGKKPDDYPGMQEWLFIFLALQERR